VERLAMIAARHVVRTYQSIGCHVGEPLPSFTEAVWEK